MNEAKTGSVVNIHYRGTFEDGTEFDNSHLRNEPMTVEVGSGQLISGFDSALLAWWWVKPRPLILPPTLRTVT